MLIKLQNGSIYDPAQNLHGEQRDLFIQDGLMANDPGQDAKFDAVYDLAGKIVMAGAVDIHSHIAGGNVNTARLLVCAAIGNCRYVWRNSAKCIATSRPARCMA